MNNISIAIRFFLVPTRSLCAAILVATAWSVIGCQHDNAGEASNQASGSTTTSAQVKAPEKPIEEACTKADKQPDTDQGSSVSMAGQMTISDDVTGSSDANFDCKPLVPLKKGDKLAASGSSAMDRVSECKDSAPIPEGPGSDRLPNFSILAMYSVGNGQSESVIPAATTLKTAVKAGQVIKSGSYVLEALHDFKAGDRFCSLMVGSSVFSFEGIDQGTSGAGTRPCFAAFLLSESGDARVAEVEAWRKTQR